MKTNMLKANMLKASMLKTNVRVYAEYAANEYAEYTASKSRTHSVYT